RLSVVDHGPKLFLEAGQGPQLITLRTAHARPQHGGNDSLSTTDGRESSGRHARLAHPALLDPQLRESVEERDAPPLTPTHGISDSAREPHIGRVDRAEAEL